MKIEINMPGDAVGLREALCRCINAELTVRSVPYRTTGLVFTIEPEKAPEPVLVPLGENVTRDGHKARVICVDRIGDRGVSVIALVKGGPGDGETLKYYSPEGTVCEAYRGNDLIGHLPPSRDHVEQETERFLAECKTWVGGASQDATAAAMINFAKRAKELQLLRAALP